MNRVYCGKIGDIEFHDDAVASLAVPECVQHTNNQAYIPRHADSDDILDAFAYLS